MHVQGQERDFALKLRHIEAINSSQQVSRIKKMAIEAGEKYTEVKVTTGKNGSLHSINFTI
jgi:hypothetical protein